VVQLSYIELPPIGSGGPPEENVRCWLHQALSHHDALSVVGVRASSGVRFDYRLHGFLELQKQRIVGLRHHQGDPASPADAADADHFDGDVDETVAIKQDAPLGRQRFPVTVKKFLEGCHHAGRTGAVGMEDQRWLIGNADLSAHRTRELRKIKFRASVRRCLIRTASVEVSELNSAVPWVAIAPTVTAEIRPVAVSGPTTSCRDVPSSA